MPCVLLTSQHLGVLAAHLDLTDRGAAYPKGCSDVADLLDAAGPCGKRAISVAPILPGAVAWSAAGMGCCKHRWRHSRLSPPSSSCNQGKFSKFVQRENP